MNGISVYDSNVLFAQVSVKSQSAAIKLTKTRPLWFIVGFSGVKSYILSCQYGLFQLFMSYRTKEHRRILSHRVERLMKEKNIQKRQILCIINSTQGVVCKISKPAQVAVTANKAKVTTEVGINLKSSNLRAERTYLSDLLVPDLSTPESKSPSPDKTTRARVAAINGARHLSVPPRP